MLSDKPVMSYKKSLDHVVNDIKSRYLNGDNDTRPNGGYVKMISFIYSKPLVKVEADVEKLYRQTKMSML